MQEKHHFPTSAQYPPPSPFQPHSHPPPVNNQSLSLWFIFAVFLFGQKASSCLLSLFPSHPLFFLTEKVAYYILLFFAFFIKQYIPGNHSISVCRHVSHSFSHRCSAMCLYQSWFHHSFLHGHLDGSNILPIQTV